MQLRLPRLNRFVPWGRLAGALLAALPPLSAQTAPPGPPPPPAEARQFDFWIGDWEVFTPDGRPAGENRIERIAAGWGLLEHWSGPGGANGWSLNTWVPGKSQWRQFWVGLGGALELSGGLDAAGRMVLVGETVARDGRRLRQRITWTPEADGTVRQHWEQSAEETAGWKTVFDGRYRRKAAPPSTP